MWKQHSIHLIFLLAFLSAGCNGKDNNSGPDLAAQSERSSKMELTLTSSVFKNGETIPEKHTADGADISPPLSWGDVPANTEAFALIMDDPDAPAGTWVHWVLANIEGETRSINEGVPAEETVLGSAVHGKNDFGNYGYGGPAPPPGKPHRYFFKLYALDTILEVDPGITKDGLLQAMQGHILAEAELIGKYER